MLQTDSGFDAAYTQARIYIMQEPRWAFYTALLLLLEDLIDKDQSVDTAATDGLKLWINSSFFMALSTKGQRATLLAHESMHVALKHMVRVDFQTQEEWDDWNRAGDHVINLMLEEDGFEPIPGWLCDHKYKGMTTEQVYKDLRANPPPSSATAGGGSGPGAQMGGDLRKPDLGKPDDTGNVPDAGAAMAELSGKIDVMLRQAEQQAIAAGLDPGKIPGDVRAYLDSLVKPKLPMRALLRKFMRNIAKLDYSWRKINRRFHPMLLPGLQSDGSLMHIAFWFDMSCSVSKKDYTRYMSEMTAVMRGMKPEILTLGQFDTQVKSVEKIKSLKDLAKVELRGRGGTDIECVMEWAKKHKPHALVVFSDGEYDHPSFNPGCPILWLIHGHRREFHCDFGHTVMFET